MGSDQRTGKGNKGYGNFEGARSDTTMLLHVYPDRESAVVVSIPRDTIVDLPSCKDDDDKVLPPTRDRFNVAFDRGGPGCTLKTVEAMTGLTVDHFVVLDFNGFKKTIDALGGVEVCLTRPLQDSKSGVDLPAGRTRVSGEDALAFVRVRHNIGDGSDISRINRQQIFLSSLIQEVTGSGLLTDPLRVWRVLNESSKAIATDKALADSDGLIALAASLSGLRPKDVSFVTLPWLPNADGATIVADQPKADAIWAALAAEQPWPPPPTKGADGEKLTEAPAEILVDVHNATGVEGQGSRAAEDLAAQGFRIGAIDAREKAVGQDDHPALPGPARGSPHPAGRGPRIGPARGPRPGRPPGPDPGRDLRRGAGGPGQGDQDRLGGRRQRAEHDRRPGHLHRLSRRLRAAESAMADRRVGHRPADIVSCIPTPRRRIAWTRPSPALPRPSPTSPMAHAWPSAGSACAASPAP